MYSAEQVNLWEAYQAIYEPQEITEEVQIAAHYFYEMGLNEDGVDILIEELGVEEFVDFVYDIAEEYYLTEARRGPGGTKVRIEPVSKTGKPYKGTKKAPGKPPEKRIEELRAKKAERREAEEKASAEKPSGMKASLKRQSAIAAASKKQPQKPGLLDRLAGAVNRGIERHNAAMSAARDTGKVIGKAAKGAGQVAKEFGSGVSTVAKIGKKVLTGEEVEAWVNALVEEGYDLSEYTWEDMIEIYLGEERRDPNFQSYDIFDTILEYLVAEGYADTNENALIIMANMSEDWRQSIIDEAYQEPRFNRKHYLEKLSKRGGMGMGTPDDPHGYRDPGMRKVGDEFRKRKTAAAKAKETGEPDSYRAEKEAQSKRR